MVEVLPGVGVGPVRFGMTPRQVAAGLMMNRQEMAWAPRAPKDELYTSEPTDVPVHGVRNVSVSYGDDGLCACLGFSPEPGFRLQYEGLELLQRPAQQVLDWMRERDPGLEYRAATGTYVSRLLGVALAAEFLSTNSTEDAPAEAILVFRPGHF